MWMQLVRMEPVGGSAGASPSAVLWLFLLFYLLGDIAGIMLLAPGNSARRARYRCRWSASRARRARLLFRGGTVASAVCFNEIGSTGGGASSSSWPPPSRRGAARSGPASTMRACGSAARSWWTSRLRQMLHGGGRTDGRHTRPCPYVRRRLDACCRPGGRAHTVSFSECS
jgi:hypothetical protein